MIGRLVSRDLALLLCAAAFLPGGCATNSTISRIDANRALYESWPLEVKEAILDQKAIKGMTPEMVRMALGKPDEIQTRIGSGGQEEQVWVYGRSNLGDEPSPMQNTSIVMGGSAGGVGILVDPAASQPVNPMSMPPEEDTRKEVLFRNEVVVRGTN